MALGNYLKTAFLNRWNLLTFFAGLGVAALSGHPDIVAPLILAGEAAYLGLLGAHPKFQSYVDAQQAKQLREQQSTVSQQALQQIWDSLPERALSRFEALRARCADLRKIAMAMRAPVIAGVQQPLDSFQVQGLDRLLWIYLRLLFTEYSLDLFLKKTDQRQIEDDIKRLEKRLADALPAGSSPQADKVRQALDANLATSRARLENLSKARDNFELVQLQIDGLENKIRSLSEVAVNRQEPDFIAGQVDQVASSMLETERTMNELRFATGLEDLHEEVPELMQQTLVQVKQ